jgi:glucokinase
MSCAVGVDLGGTKMLAGVVDAPGDILYSSRDVDFGNTAERILDELEDQVRLAREAWSAAEVVGLGIPCTMDRERGVAISAVNLPIVNVPVRDLMRERLGMPVFVDNDANLAMLAEHRHGVARGTRNAMLLTIGTGIGGGVMLEGELYRGSTGAAAELGHVVVDENGPPCQGNCPNRGCVETMASGTALAREGRKAAERAPDSTLGRLLGAGEPIDGKAVTDAALDGDEVAAGVVREAGRQIGVALASLANAFEPEVFVLGGGVMAAGDLLREPAQAELRARALPPMNEIPVVAAELGPDAGMVGAATMALDEAKATAERAS